MPCRRSQAVAGVSLTCRMSFLAMLVAYRDNFGSLRRVANLPANPVDRRQQFGRQGGTPGVEAFVELGDAGHADDRAGHAPAAIAEGQRHLRRREAMLAGQGVVAPRRSNRLRAAPALLPEAFEEHHAPPIGAVVETPL